MWILLYFYRDVAISFSPTSFSFRGGNRQRELHAASASSTDASLVDPVPITLLSGFLGAGKTSTLKYLLEKNEGTKIGVIVNDMASVNIDAKLVQSQTPDMVELKNGCACCSLSDELFFSVEKICKDRDLDAIVVELSGVADPASIQKNWAMAPMELRREADVARVVTLVDSKTFGTDYLTWDVAGDRPGWTEPTAQCSGNSHVSELLVEQVEAASLVLINKCDLASDEEIEVASKVSRALNSNARLEKVSFGEVSPSLVLGTRSDLSGSEPKSEHSHSHDHHCEEVDCDHPSHSHSHDHDCQDEDCTDPSHSHSHDHSADGEELSHSHGHEHAATSTADLGITSFAYKHARPFHPNRLMGLLNTWPVPIKDTLDLGLLEEAGTKGAVINGKVVHSPFTGVIRSKGFCWLAPTRWSGAHNDAYRHDTAMFWSHAGKHFGFSAAGKWWSSMPRNKMKKFFDENMDEYHKIIENDFVSHEWGDRRQEIVFIGVNLDEGVIREALDDCLLTDEEFDDYRSSLKAWQDTFMG